MDFDRFPGMVPEPESNIGLQGVWMLATASSECAAFPQLFPQIGSAAQPVDPLPDLPGSHEPTSDGVAATLRVTLKVTRMAFRKCRRRLGLFRAPT